jgi:hypothetical protein
MVMKIKIQYLSDRSRDSAVGTAIAYGLDGRGVEFEFP